MGRDAAVSRPDLAGHRAGLVSVMMPAYNASRFIARAVRSLIGQTYPDWELIVVDDGSTDGTGDIARGVRDPRITIVRQVNRGEAASRNAALALAGGEFVAFLDADDIFFPDHLHVMVHHLSRHPDHAGVYADGYYVSDDETRLGTFSGRRGTRPSGPLFDQVVLRSDIVAPPLSVVLRLDVVRRQGLRFDEDIGLGTDWDFFTRVAETGDFGYVDQPTCLYRLHGANMTIQTAWQARLSGIAACRSKAIRMSRFARCPPPVKAAVFYDLLVNALGGRPDRQQEAVDWPQFRDLPMDEQARLLRLMASGTILARGDDAVARRWLAQAAALNPSDLRAQALRRLCAVSPRLCRLVLRLRRTRLEAPASWSPYADLGAGAAG
jgi:glycosyltransferase involved in cell wall biosynthesis